MVWIEFLRLWGLMVIRKSSQRVCLGCGASSGEDAKFCAQCGAAFSISCLHCGSVNLPFFQYCAGCGQNLHAQAADAPAPAESPRPRAPELKAERRHLTVMFCDLSGSTKLSTLLDPEDLFGLLSSYRMAAADVVTQFGGTIAQFLGDGILAFFGYPAASEDDAERAVRSGLEIVRRASGVETGRDQPLSVRVGIASGLVVVGDRQGAGESGEKSAAGEALNLAARLQALAPENGVIIAESTRRLVGNIFTLQEVVFPEAKGFSHAITAFAVTGASEVDSRFEALRIGERTVFVGRDEEVSLLMRRWGQITQGEGRAVLVQGDPGIGKSRIVDQVCAELEKHDFSCVRFFGSPLHTQSALYPILRHITREAEIRDSDSVTEKLAALARLFPSAEDDTGMHLIAGLLGLAEPGKDRDLMTLGPLQRRERMLAALLDRLFALVRRKPMLIIFEDAHWMDPTSLELLDRLVAQIAGHPILLVVCARPDYQPAWADHSTVTLLALNRLGSREGAAMIASIAHGKILPVALSEQILNRGDGVPLFIEELTRAVLESGTLIEQTSHFALRGSPPAQALPQSLQASLVARLDRLASAAKDLVQVGAVIGREFSYQLLESVAGLPAPEMEDSLTQLTRSGLIHRRGKGTDAIYIFKHALVQDAAYGTLLKGRRQEIHGAIARALLDKFPTVATNQPEVLAHHLTVAGDYPAAIQFWLAAGRLQIRASADLEGIEHLQRGVELTAKITDSKLASELELILQAALIGPLVAVEGPSSRRVAVCCERGLALASAGGGSPYLFPFMYGHYTNLVATGQIRKSAAVARQFIETAKRAGYDPGVVIGHRLLGLALFALGELQAARDALDTSLALYDPARDENITYLFGQNAKVNSQSVLSITLYLLGDEEQAKAVGYEALKGANKIKHPHSMAIAMCYFGCWVLYLSSDHAEMAVQAERLVTIAEEYGLGTFGLMGHFFVGWSRFTDGGIDDGLAIMESAINTLLDMGFRLSLPNLLCILAQARLAAGQLMEARENCEAARRLMEASEERWLEPEILCVEAQLAFSAGEIGREEAEARFNLAAEFARAAGSPALEARCMRRIQSVATMQLA